MVDRTVSFTVTNSSTYCASTKSFFIDVKTLPVTTALPVTVCAASPFDIAISSDDPSATYSWNASVMPPGITGAPTSGSGAHITGTAEGSGTASYSISTTGSNGCSNAYNPSIVNLNVNANPFINATLSPNPASVCEGSYVSISVSTPPSPSGFSYTLTSIPSGFIFQSAGGNQYNYGVGYNAGPTSGDFVVTSLNPTTTCGRTLTLPVTVKSPPAAPAITASPTTGCPGTPGAFSVAPVAGSTYSWTLQGGVTLNQCGSTGCSYTFGNSPGTLTVTATDAVSGCTAKTAVTLTGLPNPSVYANTSPPSICSGQTTNISLSSNIPNPIFSWGAGLSSGNTQGFSSGTGSSIQQTLSGVGTVMYGVSLANGNGCPPTPTTFVFQQVESFPVSVNVTSTPAFVPIATTVNATFTANVTNGGTAPTYQWMFCASGTSTYVAVGTNSPTYARNGFIIAGRGVPGDKVYCTVTSNKNCTTNNPANSNIKTISCKGCRESVEEEFSELLDEISVFPNPFSGSVTLLIPNLNEQTATLIVSDINGKEMEKLVTGSSYTELGNNLPAGFYILKVAYPSGTKTFKITKIN